MFPCFHRGCSGHDRELAAIHHTLEHLVTTVDQLAQDFATFQTDVQTGFDALKAQIAASNPNGIPADVQAKIDALDATINSADVAVKAETTTAPPAPTAPAADGSSTPTDVPPAA